MPTDGAPAPSNRARPLAEYDADTRRWIDAAAGLLGLSLRQMRYRMARLGVVVAGVDNGD